ncbi:MAG: nuclear transport factor 2 family protein [Pseudomonadota bacterium]
MKKSFVRVLKLSFLIFAVVCGVTSVVAAQEKTDQVKLVERHIKAQAEFDQATLTAITHSKFVEISPRGEQDEREKMLSFYAPDKKSKAPEMTMKEVSKRDFGDTQFIVMSLSYQITMQEQVRQVQMRASFVTCKENQEWKICSAQYTPVR